MPPGGARFAVWGTRLDQTVRHSQVPAEERPWQRSGLERQIYKIDGFRVRILHGRDRRDVRGDKEGVPGYHFERAMKHDANVAQWRRQRFARSYPGFRVEVLHADGTTAHGATRLGTVRRDYLDT